MTNVMTKVLMELGPFGGSFWLPQNSSSSAGNTDWAWDVILWVSTFFFVIVVGSMTLFVVRYRRRSANEQTSTVTHNTPLEIFWSGVPLIIVIFFFMVGFKGWMDYNTPPTDAYVINVEAHKWGFQFTYPNGATSADHLYVPLNRDVHLVMTSSDVLHALYIPAFRISRNIIPMRTTDLWFRATKANAEPGFYAFCTQYCGAGHSTMMAHVHVMPTPEEFDKKLAELANPFFDSNGNPIAYKDVGEKIWSTNCKTCHSNDGSPNIGPTWKGLWRSDVAFSATDAPGYTLKASDPPEKWDAYIRESVLKPEAKIVQGFGNAMPSFQSTFAGSAAGPVNVKEEKLKAVIEYIKSIGSEPYDEAKGPKFPGGRPGGAASGPATGATTGAATGGTTGPASPGAPQ